MSFTSMPRIGDEAPNFRAVTTDGEIMFHEWQGDKWVLFFSHPASFTPVCSTELTEFSRRKSVWDKLNAKCLGISIDSIHTHLAWIDSMEETHKERLSFPLIADNGTIARMFGMLHPHESSTATVRALFVIDPKHIVRAIIYYPLNVGRSVDEVERLLQGLQMSENGVACPVDWKPSQKVIQPPPKTVEQSDEYKKNPNLTKQAYYMYLRDPPK